MRYANLNTWQGGKNKPNSKPIKPKQTQSNPKTNPICRKGKIGTKFAYTKDYEEIAAMSPKKQIKLQTQPLLINKMKLKLLDFLPNFGDVVSFTRLDSKRKKQEKQ